jgi:hypothetical protein
LLGTQPEDLTPAVTLHGRGFTTKAQALVLNEFAIDQGLIRSDAFDRITRVESFVKLAKSSVRVWMPRLFAAEAIESRQCRFFEGRDGKVVPPVRGNYVVDTVAPGSRREVLRQKAERAQSLLQRAALRLPFMATRSPRSCRRYCTRSAP